MADITEFFAYHGHTQYVELCLRTFDDAGYRIEQGTPLYERIAWAQLVDQQAWVSQVRRPTPVSK